VAGKRRVQKTVGCGFFDELGGAHEAVAKMRLAVAKLQRLHHAVTIQHHALAIGSAVVEAGTHPI
jgi:hypothetical protein